MRLGVLATHPIQYHAPLYRELARRVDLRVHFAHRQTAEGQAAAGFGVAFEWDVPLLDGYRYSFLHNRARRPDVSTPTGCDTPEIASIIARETYDAFLVSGWYNRSFRQAIRACWRTGTPLMVRGDSQLNTPRSPAKRLVKEAIFRRFIPRINRYLVVGQRAREYYLYYGADADRMHFVPHFVDNAWFRDRARAGEPKALRHELGVGEEAVILLFVGKLIPKKRPGDLVRAAARLRERGIDAHVVFAGSGELAETLQADAQSLQLPAHFVGFKNQSELPYYYSGADLLILPSDGGETWGLVVNEAMACGLPAVVSDEAGCGPDLVDAGKTGFVFPTGNVGALASAIERASRLKQAPAVQQALVEKMRRYSLEQATDGVIEALEEASQRRKK